MNHSANPNADVGVNQDDPTVASRDIRKGEEILVNYYDFCGDCPLTEWRTGDSL